MPENLWTLINFVDIERGEANWPELLKHIPELEALDGMEQPPDYHKYDGRLHTIHTVANLVRDHKGVDEAERDLVVMAALLHDIGKPKTRAWNEEKGRFTFYKHSDVGGDMAEVILTRLETHERDKAKIVELVRAHEFQYSDEWSDKAIKRLIKKVNIHHLAALRRADLAAQGADAEHERTELAKLDKLVSRATALGELPA